MKNSGKFRSFPTFEEHLPVAHVAEESGDSVQRPAFVHPLLCVAVGHPQRRRPLANAVRVRPLLRRARLREVHRRAVHEALPGRRRYV